jgi:hypothetical protein
MANPTMRYPGGKAKALTLSYDDGIFEDFRLIDIMTKHGLKGTFNINAQHMNATTKPADAHRERLTAEQARALYRPSGNEVALHGYTHPHLELLSRERMAYEIVMDRVGLEQMTGEIVRGMAYPFGTTNNDVVDCLEACGVAYARTVVSSGNFSLPRNKRDWLTLPATCHHNDARLMKLAEQFVNNTPRPHDPSLMFYLWGHAYEFAINDNWDVIERFAEYMGGHEDIWYATNIEIYEYIEAYGQLRWSADGNIVHNPTATTLYFNYGTTPVVLGAGETKVF